LRRLDASPLLRATAVVGQRRDIVDLTDLQPSGLQGANGRLAALTGPLDEDVHALHAVLDSPSSGLLGRELGREGLLAMTQTKNVMVSMFEGGFKWY